MSEKMCWFITGVIAAIVISFSVHQYQSKIKCAFKNGYEQTAVFGSSTIIWVKVGSVSAAVKGDSPENVVQQSLTGSEDSAQISDETSVSE